MSEEDMTPRPTIDPESPAKLLLMRMRSNEMSKRIPKYVGKDYRKMYYVLNKYRKKQVDKIRLCDAEEDMEDPDPYSPWYVFYCFKGKWEE